MDRKKVTINTLGQKKQNGVPIVMLTAYDYPSANAADSEDVDILLVGDSLGMVVLGYDSTVPVTMDEMIHHCRAVARGARFAFTVGDMPFSSYEISEEKAVENAARFLKEGSMEAVKLEGGREMAGTIRRIAGAGMSVMGHIGLTPQSISRLGGYRVQGKTAESARKLLDDALALEEAGCFSLVLEAIPEKIAEVITGRLSIPVIGIGAGVKCDGQVLVYHDLLGLTDRHVPKFVRQYAQANREIHNAIRLYSSDVRTRQFPAPEHTYAMDENELQDFLNTVKA